MKKYTESELQELKPCPFCGGNAEIKQTGKNELTIRCTECLTGKTQAVLKYSLDWLKDKLIEGWNNRPSPLLPTEEVGIKEDDLQSGSCTIDNSIQQELINLFEKCWFKHKGEPKFNAKLFGELVAAFVDEKLIRN